MIEAVIFDMDGVIVRTERIQSGAESAVFGTIGIHRTPEQIVVRYSGFKDIEMFEDVLRGEGVESDAQRLREEKWKLVYERIEREDIPEVPGAIRFIDSLVLAGYPLGLASTTNSTFIQTVLQKLGIREKFRAITSGDEVTRGKPDPQIFLITAQKLRVPADRCLVIEDAPGGVEAAKRAGMESIAITTSASRERLQEADRIIDSFDELTVEDIKEL